MPKKVFTFHHNIGRISSQGELIDLWSMSWGRQGWIPEVLKMKDTAMLEEWPAFHRETLRLPTVNAGCPGYETACYARHLAMATFPHDGGLLTDYDVMNYGLKPEDFPEPTDDLTLFEQYRVPCVCLGTRAAYRKFVETIVDYQPTLEDKIGTRPHVSDMFIAQRKKLTVAEKPRCVEYTHSGWKTASLVHWATGAVRREHRKVAKWRIIKGIRCPISEL